MAKDTIAVRVERPVYKELRLIQLDHPELKTLSEVIDYVLKKASK